MADASNPWLVTHRAHRSFCGFRYARACPWRHIFRPDKVSRQLEFQETRNNAMKPLPRIRYRSDLSAVALAERGAVTKVGDQLNFTPQLQSFPASALPIFRPSRIA